MKKDNKSPHIKALRAYVAYKQAGILDVYSRAKECAETIPDLVKDRYLLNDKLEALQAMYDESELTNRVYREKIWELEQEINNWEERENFRLERESENIPLENQER
jgi:hypothetical protein